MVGGYSIAVLKRNRIGQKVFTKAYTSGSKNGSKVSEVGAGILLYVVIVELVDASTL